LTVSNKFDSNYLNNLLKNFRLASQYELDGIVITANNISSAQGKRNGVSLNPEHSCKFKVNDANSMVTATVSNVLWEVSKSGFLKPRVEITPVELFGSTVKFATGFNGQYIKDNMIGPGAKIEITKSGTVIPYIVKVITPANTASLPNKNEFGGWHWNENNVEIVVDNPDSNEMVKFKQVLDFMDKLNVDLLKEASLYKLFDSFNLWNIDYDSAILTIIDLKEKEWEMSNGVNGVKSFNSLHRRLQNIELATLLGASKHMGIGFGIRKAKLLIDASGDNIWNLSELDIAMIDGFDTKTAKQVVNGLPDTKKLIDALINSGYINLIKVQKTNEFSNINVVMTGFRDSDLSDAIEKRGGKIGSGVSKKTTHLLTYDINSNSGKTQKAKELGIKIMTPDDFKDEFNL
jgi:NAD-dependent DNA ligase